MKIFISRLFALGAVLLMSIAQLLLEGNDGDKPKLRQAGVSGYVYAVQSHPCQHCKGEGAVFVSGNDAVACPRCRGLKVDPLYLLEPVL